MAVTLDLVSKNSLPALGGNLTFKAPSTSTAINQQVFVLNVGMLVNAGLYSLDFSNGAPTNVTYINLLDGDGAIIDSSFVNPSFSTTFNFNPSKAFAKIVLVSDNHYISWPANSNAVVSSGLISNTNSSPTPTLPTVAATNLTNALTCRNIGGTDYIWSYPTYNVANNAYYAGKIVNATTMQSQDLYSNNYRGASFAFDYTNNKMYIVGGGVYNSANGVQSHSQTMYTTFIEKNMATSSFTQTAKAAYPDALNTMNILMAAPGDGNVYTFGQSYLETSNVPTSHYFGNLAYKWNGTTNTWSAIAKMPGFPSVSYNKIFTFSYQGRVYITGARQTAVDKGSEALFDYWFGYYNPATNTYTTIKNFKTVGLSEGPAFDTMGNMNGRTYTEDADHLYDQHGRKYSKASYIATGFLPAPVYRPQYWAPTPVLAVANTPGSATQYAHYLQNGQYYLVAQTQSQVSVPSYASRV
jgi:hypothetical protein